MHKHHPDVNTETIPPIRPMRETPSGPPPLIRRIHPLCEGAAPASTSAPRSCPSADAAAAAADTALGLESGTQRTRGSGSSDIRLHVSSSADRWSKLVEVMPKSFIISAPVRAAEPEAALIRDIKLAYRVASTPSGHSLCHQEQPQKQQYWVCALDKMVECHTHNHSHSIAKCHSDACRSLCYSLAGG